MIRFVQSNRSQPFLMPPDVWEQVPNDDLCHIITEAVERVGTAKITANHCGSGSRSPTRRSCLLTQACSQMSRMHSM